MKKITALALAALVAASLASCSLPQRELGEPKTQQASAPGPDTIEGDPAPEPEPAPEPAPAEVGTFANPGTPGSSITMTSADNMSYSMFVKEVNFNANQLVADANMFNAGAPAGFHYVVITVVVTNDSADTSKGVRPGSAAYDLSIVDASSGTSFSQEFVVLPNDLSGQNEIYTGQTAEGQIAYLVPDSTVSMLVAAGGVFVTL